MSAYFKNIPDSLKQLSEKVFTVTEILDFLNQIMRPCEVIVKGEVGEKINSYPGFLFFNLIDQSGSVLPCFCFRDVLDSLGVELNPGMEIKIKGHPEIRKNKGSFNFQVKKISPVGEGDLKKQFDFLRKKLTKDGYFLEDKKQKIVDFPKNIGLITSFGSDAEKDFLTHLEDFGFSVFCYNSRVEGESAISDLVSGVEYFNKNFVDLDVIVITRGGGGWESFLAFNSEEIVKAAYSSKIPIISGVGHENDISLLDLVSDKRVSTPTDAGKFLSKYWRDAKEHILSSEKSISLSTRRLIIQIDRKFSEYLYSFKAKIEIKTETINKELNYFFYGLTDKVKTKIDQFYYLEKELVSQIYKIKFDLSKNMEKVDYLEKSLEKNKLRWTETLQKKILTQNQKLSLSNPRLKLKQGYSITKKDGKILKQVSNIKNNDIIETTLDDGVVTSRVKKNE